MYQSAQKLKLQYILLLGTGISFKGLRTLKLREPLFNRIKRRVAKYNKGNIQGMTQGNRVLVDVLANDGLYGEGDREKIQRANRQGTNDVFQILVTNTSLCRNLMDKQTINQRWVFHQQTLKSQHSDIMCHSQKIAGQHTNQKSVRALNTVLS